MRYYYYYYGKRPGLFSSLLTILGGVLFLLAFFFLALPVFLAALVVFCVVSLYVVWRMKRALKDMEDELGRGTSRRTRTGYVGARHVVRYVGARHAVPLREEKDPGVIIDIEKESIE